MPVDPPYKFVSGEGFCYYIKDGKKLDYNGNPYREPPEEGGPADPNPSTWLEPEVYLPVAPPAPPPVKRKPAAPKKKPGRPRKA